MKTILKYLFGFISIIYISCSCQSKISETEKPVLTSSDSITQEKDTKGETLESVYNEIIKGFRDHTSTNLKSLDKYIDPDFGFFVLFDGHTNFPEFINEKSFEELVNGEGHEAEAMNDFLHNLEKVNPERLKLNTTYKANPRNYNELKKGSYAVLITEPRYILSNIYENMMKNPDVEMENDQLKKYNNIDTKLRTEIAMNVFEGRIKPYRESLYFEIKNDRWYLVVIDLSSSY